MSDDKFQQPSTQAQYKADEAKQINSDVNKDISASQLEQNARLKTIDERLNHELMDMIQGNETFIRFIGKFMETCCEWGDRNGLEFWEVGIDGGKSWYSHDGKTIMFQPCRTEKNPNPLTGEKKSGGIILPGPL